jgi:DNA-binding transcriptional MocR family regulator
MATVSARALALVLDGWRDGGTAYAALADRIRLLVLDGRIATGTRLPAERELASQLGVSRTTVTAAYAELRDAGYLESLRGSGSVARLPYRAPTTIESQPDFIDFSKATLPAAPQVLEAAQWAVAELPHHLADAVFDPIGSPLLTAALAQRYTDRGLPTDPDQIMVTVGAQHAIALIARTLVARGDRVIIENPTYPHAAEALRVAGGRPVPVGVSTEHGWDEDALEQAFQRTSPSVAYLMPDSQNPTGRTMDEDLRRRTIEWATASGTTLVVDETMAELWMEGGGQPPFAMHGPAILVGSVGKTVWGGLRLGWIRADRTVIQRLVRERAAGDLGTPLIDQLVLVRLLEGFDDLLAQRRTLLREGRATLEAALAQHLPEWHVPHPRGGLSAWVNLGAPVSSQLALAARNEGLVIAAGPRFGMDGAFERFIRVPFSLGPEVIERGVAALASAWSTVTRMPVVGAEQELAGVV